MTRSALESPATIAPAPAGAGDGDSVRWAGAALEAALRVRAPGVHESTPLVRQLAQKVARELGLDTETQTLLDLAARVRDVGMLSLPDAVVLRTAPLSPDDWELMNRHPILGEQLVGTLSVLAPSASIVRAHHERWDGGGYPDGISGDEIPMLSRVIATCDAFVAIASDRPHRRGIGPEAALARVCQERGSQLDPQIVDALVAAFASERKPVPAARRASSAEVVPTAGSDVRQEPAGRRGLVRAIAEFGVVPAFAPAYERVLAATRTDGVSGGELVTAIESDTGLTVAVLRGAQTIGSRRQITNVADAVAALGTTGIKQAIADLPRAEFPWRTSELEVLMHRSRVHAQAVARAADRIARELGPAQRDDVIVVALLHDIGKLVLSRAFPEYSAQTEQTATPEERVRDEQRAWGVDHASLGGLLLHRWKLPPRLVSAVAAHHSSEAENAVATYVRLADKVAHHSQGERIDRRKMLSLAQLCGLSPQALRDVMFDLPHAGGSQRRRAERSPLSDRETAVLRILSEGKVYKVIAGELGVSISTVRTHLHNIYTKLGVDDRAQAVLRATELGWI